MSQQFFWGEEETKLFEAIDKTQDLNVLQPLLANLRHPNAFHFWNDVRISSLKVLPFQCISGTICGSCIVYFATMLPKSSSWPLLA